MARARVSAPAAWLTLVASRRAAAAEGKSLVAAAPFAAFALVVFALAAATFRPPRAHASHAAPA